MADQELFKFGTFMALLVGGPLVFMFVGYKKKLDWNGKKSFKVMAPYLILILLLSFIWVFPSNTIEDWIFNIALLLLGVFSLYGIALAADARRNMKKTEK